MNFIITCSLEILHLSVHILQKQMCAYLMDTCVVKEGQQCSTVGTGTTFIIDHSHVNAFGVSTNTQAHQTDLNYRQKELETEGPEHKPGEHIHY